MGFTGCSPRHPNPSASYQDQNQGRCSFCQICPCHHCSSTGSAKRKPRIAQQKNLLEDLCELKSAIRMYPSNKDSLKETGIPHDLLVKREHRTSHAGTSMYLCHHPKCQDPAFFAQSPVMIYSHVCHKHLGIALACPYCQDKGWKSHMDSMHKSVPHFGSSLVEEA